MRKTIGKYYIHMSLSSKFLRNAQSFFHAKAECLAKICKFSLINLQLLMCGVEYTKCQAEELGQRNVINQSLSYDYTKTDDTSQLKKLIDAGCKIENNIVGKVNPKNGKRIRGTRIKSLRFGKITMETISDGDNFRIYTLEVPVLDANADLKSLFRRKRADLITGYGQKLCHDYDSTSVSCEIEAQEVRFQFEGDGMRSILWLCLQD